MLFDGYSSQYSLALACIHLNYNLTCKGSPSDIYCELVSGVPCTTTTYFRGTAQTQSFLLSLPPQGLNTKSCLSADQSGLRLVHGLFAGLSTNLLSLRPSRPFSPAFSLALSGEQVCRSTAWRAAFTAYERWLLLHSDPTCTSSRCLHLFTLHAPLCTPSYLAVPCWTNPCDMQAVKVDNTTSMLNSLCAARACTTPCRLSPVQLRQPFGYVPVPLAASPVALLSTKVTCELVRRDQVTSDSAPGSSNATLFLLSPH
jgi:hypothetical protein